MTQRCISFFFALAVSTITLAQGGPYRRGLPSEPGIISPIASPDSFPAKQHHVKKLRCYDKGRKIYSAQYDAEGRIVRLEDFTHDSLKPNVTSWKYTTNSTLKTTVVPPCRACAKSTTITDRWKTEGESTIHMHITKTYFKEGKRVDSVYVHLRSDGGIQDSAVFQNNSLVYSWKQTFHPNGKVRHFEVIDNGATETFDHDTAGNPVKYIMSKSGRVEVMRTYQYGSNGKWSSFQEANDTGLVYYSETMEYDENNNPTKRTVSDSTYGFMNYDEEVWSYDEQGRWVWHAETSSQSYFYRRYLNDESTDYVELKRKHDRLRKTEVHTVGNVRTMTVSVHLKNGTAIPKPGLELEADTFFRVESIEEYDVRQNMLIRKIKFEHDLKKPNVKISEHLYTYDEYGRLLKEVSWHVERGVEKTGASVFQYNSAGQKTGYTFSRNNGEPEIVSKLTYSETGLLLQSDSCRDSRCVVDSFAYDSLNRMVLAVHRREKETRTYRFGYDCGTTSYLQETFVGGFMNTTEIKYLQTCLPSRYTVTREWGVYQDMKWEYEYY